MGPTKPEAGVMATRPATAPEQMPTTVGLPFSDHSTSIQVKAATAVAIWVTNIAIPACMPAETAEPALKPNQPTQSREAPMKVSTMLCAGPFAPGGVVAGSQEPVRSPDPVRNWRINENRPQADEPKHGREFHALGERAGNERRRNNSKRHLKADVHAFGDGRGEWIGIADTTVTDVTHDVPEKHAIQ